MIDYLIFPIIGLIVASGAVQRVFTQTGSHIFAFLAGLAGFLFCLGVSGHLLYGCILATLFSILLIVSFPEIPTKSSSRS